MEQHVVLQLNFKKENFGEQIVDSEKEFESSGKDATLLGLKGSYVHTEASGLGDGNFPPDKRNP